MSNASPPPQEPSGRRWPAPVRYPVYALLALVLAVLLSGIAFCLDPSQEGNGWRAIDEIVSLVRQDYTGSGGGGRLFADWLCALPWVLAAFSRSPRLGSMHSDPSAGGTSLVLKVAGLTVVCVLLGQTVRNAGEVTEQNIRLVLAHTVAFLPLYLAFGPALVLFNRIKGGGFTALGLVLLFTLAARMHLPAMFEVPIYFNAEGRVTIFPPGLDRAAHVFTPMLAIWGIFTLIEMRFHHVARQGTGRPPGGPGHS
jgi:hypothetical protein